MERDFTNTSLTLRKLLLNTFFICKELEVLDRPPCFTTTWLAAGKNRWLQVCYMAPHWKTNQMHHFLRYSGLGSVIKHKDKAKTVKLWCAERQKGPVAMILRHLTVIELCDVCGPHKQAGMYHLKTL